MVRLDRIYTRTGDDGSTALVGGERVPKTHPRICAFGAVDELNACIGLARERNMRHGGDEGARDHLDAELGLMQRRLFDLGASLATPPESRRPGRPAVREEDVAALEALIDACNAELPPLGSFVLPGGGPVGAMLHLARTVCRRAERETLRLMEEEGEGEQGEGVELRYLNRLSDALFVLGRWIAARLGETETLWRP